MRLPPTSPKAALLPGLLLASLPACERGSRAKLEEVEHQLELGALERAIGILEDADGPTARELRAAIQRALAEATAAPGQDPAARRRNLTRLDQRITRAAPEQRAELAREARALIGDSSEAALHWRERLSARWASAVEVLDRSPLRSGLESLADARRELDRRRAAALALIEDSERYFYPYDPPDQPDRNYAQYVLVNREVQELVGAVQELWTSDGVVELEDGALRAGADLGWIRAQAEDLRPTCELPAHWPAWYGELEWSRPEHSLDRFAWTPEEARRFAQDAAIAALNEERYVAARNAGLPAPDDEERRLLELVNDYRRSMGRRPLAWDVRLYAAARRHALYLSERDLLQHDEPDVPGRETAELRMRAEGYPEPHAENCQRGGEGALRTFLPWRSSSQHHRQMLDALARETGVARSGIHWTQDFGRGTTFEDELRTWRD